MLCKETFLLSILKEPTIFLHLELLYFLQDTAIALPCNHFLLLHLTVKF